MSEQGIGDNGNFADLFFASILDPEANVRRLTAIQAEGFRAASELVDRFVRMATPNSNGTVHSKKPPANPTQEGNAGENVDGAIIEPLLRSWMSLTDQFLRGSRQSADETPNGPAKLDLDKVEAQGALDLTCRSAGVARGEVWLHNRGLGNLGDVRLRCSELLAHDGHVISSAAIEFDPAVVPMPGRSSRGVSVKILVDQEAPPAKYCGTLLAEGFPDLAIPVAVTVQPPAS
ncbi:hypothetical protein [Mycolicibacterium stellerae]|uniref:hypothetical protein n=1 Tax=Mycolicibacterium stellerae TaxID=2358193 RepID=UPI000F0B10A9|nr:hypothetical protein [Mycolicibacterium stellerae]